MQKEQPVERKAREDRGKLRSAQEQGLLDPLIEYLDREIDRLYRPIEPEGAEWPFKRAKQDGEIVGFAKVKERILNLTKISPDEAENTEDGHGPV